MFCIYIKITLGTKRSVFTVRLHLFKPNDLQALNAKSILKINDLGDVNINKSVSGTLGF